MSIVLIMILPFIVRYSGSPSLGFGLCITTLLIFGIFAGILQASTFAYSGMLPPKYMGAIMFGNGVSGIIIGLLRALCLIIFPPDQGDNAFIGTLIYFILSALILAVCFFAQFYLDKSRFVAYYVKKAQKEHLKTERRISGMDEADLIHAQDIN